MIPSRPLDPAFRGRTLPLLLLLGCVLLGLSVSLQVHSMTARCAALPVWDAAAHGLDALRLADDARHLRPLSFLTRIHRMGGWPPLAPLMIAPAFLLFGYDYGVGEGALAFFLFLVVAACGGIGLALGGRRGALVGSVTAALAASSPLYQLMGSVIMLEIPGALLLLLALAAYLRQEEAPSAPRERLTAGLTLALFFCKYNYGLLWLATLGLMEAWKHWPSLGPALRKACARVPGLLRRPWFLLLSLYLLFLLLIFLTGGWTLRLAGRTVSVHSLGNPALGLCWVLVLVFFLRYRQNCAGARGLLCSLPSFPRRLVLIVLLPAFLWLLVPSHMKSFFSFVENRSSDLGLLSPAGLLYYPRSAVVDFAPSKVVGLATLLFALAALVRMRSWRQGERIIPLAFLAGLILTSLHRYKEPRFFFTVAPMVWLSAALCFASLVEFCLARARSWMRTAAVLLLGVGILAAAALGGRNPGDARRRFEAFSVPGDVRPVVEWIAQTGSEGALVLGAWNRLSPALVEWQCRLLHPDLPEDRLPVFERHVAGRAARILDWMAGQQRISRALVLDLEAAGPEARREFMEDNEGLPELGRALCQDRRMEREGRRFFDSSGYSVTTYLVRTSFPVGLADPARSR